MLRTPESLEKFLAEDELKLYRLIWMRFVASQMTPAVLDQTTIDINAKGKSGTDYLFRATGSVLKFDGFLKVYEEGKDQKDEDDEDLKNKLPLVTEGEKLKFKEITPEQHFTEPPPRYNEATLVKKLEVRRRGPAFDLCFDPVDDPGTRVRQERRRQVLRRPSLAPLSRTCCSKASTTCST